MELPTPNNVIQQVKERARSELTLKNDDALPDQITFRRRDKSIILHTYIIEEMVT